MYKAKKTNNKHTPIQAETRHKHAFTRTRQHPQGRQNIHTMKYFTKPRSFDETLHKAGKEMQQNDVLLF